MANAIENNLRRRIQPPEAMPARHGIEPGMIVLEVGPGNGTYTIVTAQAVGDKGKVVAIDIEPFLVLSKDVDRSVRNNGFAALVARGQLGTVHLVFGFYFPKTKPRDWVRGM